MWIAISVEFWSAKEKMSKQLIPKEEIKKLKAETEQQLKYARKQMVFWSKKVEQMTGSLAMCNVILDKAKLEEASKKTKNG